MILHNPVLRGSHPDPSIVRVGTDYFLATSTFEWWPAVRFHHSTDLVNWRTIGHAISDPTALDLRGIAASAGVWAPSLTHSDGMFWLVFGVVRTLDGAALDVTNVLMTATSLAGPWSQPVALGSHGFDGSMFHDADGRRYLVGVRWDPRPGRESFAGICLTEYSHAERSLIGPTTVIFTRPGLIEGPNIYRIGGQYLLLLAQGGTGFEHGVSAARSTALHGPYHPDPQFSVMTTRGNPSHPLQKAGHGELVDTPGGDLYLTHLAARVSDDGGHRFSVTGREACLQRVAIDDGWIRLADDEGTPVSEVVPRLHVRSTVAPPAAPRSLVSPDVLDSFDAGLPDDLVWSTLRTPADPDWANGTARPGWLRMFGRQSVASLFEVSLIGTRVQEPRATWSVVVEATPRTLGHRAGLAAWYDRHGYFWLFIGRADDGTRFAAVESSRDTAVDWLPAVTLPSHGPVELRVRLAGGTLGFDVVVNGNVAGTWPDCSALAVSDDLPGRLRFTGCMAALIVEDHDGDGFYADFDDFELRYPTFGADDPPVATSAGGPSRTPAPLADP